MVPPHDVPAEDPELPEVAGSGMSDHGMILPEVELLIQMFLQQGMLSLELTLRLSGLEGT